jgi:hypothetical protein
MSEADSAAKIAKLVEGVKRGSYWTRVEAAARDRWAIGRFVTLSELVTDARDLIDEIDRQRAAEEEAVP